MTSSAKAEAALALHRFGMGPRPGSIAAIASDPRGALLAELENPPAYPAAASVAAKESVLSDSFALIVGSVAALGMTF